jgi:hypothetical protein
MKNVIKLLAVILTVAGSYLWGTKGEIVSLNEKVFNTKGKHSEVARAPSTQRQYVQGQEENITVSSAPETGEDEPAEIARTASLDVELTPLEPLTEPETGVDDPEGLTRLASLDPILDELPPAEPLMTDRVDDPEEITRTDSLEPILDEQPAEGQ